MKNQRKLWCWLDNSRNTFYQILNEIDVKKRQKNTWLIHSRYWVVLWIFKVQWRHSLKHGLPPMYRRWVELFFCVWNRQLSNFQGHFIHRKVEGEKIYLTFLCPFLHLKKAIKKFLDFLKKNSLKIEKKSDRCCLKICNLNFSTSDVSRHSRG